MGYPILRVLSETDYAGFCDLCRATEIPARVAEIGKGVRMIRPYLV
jgi:hypothetical protein